VSVGEVVVHDSLREAASEGLPEATTFVSAQLDISAAKQAEEKGALLALEKRLEERTGKPEDLLVAPKFVLPNQHLDPSAQRSIAVECGVD
jgi:hypothetical protein